MSFELGLGLFFFIFLPLMFELEYWLNVGDGDYVEPKREWGDRDW